MIDIKKKILVVDDEPDLTQLIGFQFQAKGFEVKTAGDGIEALAIVHDFAPDLIILDVNMPRMGGIEFYSKISTESGKPQYPVLVLTARSNVKGLFQDLYIDGFMVKPFEIDELIHEAERIIKAKNKMTNKDGTIGSKSSVRRICIAQEDQKIFDQMSNLFLNKGYAVIPARNGATAIELITSEVPDIALVELGLKDIAGDIVIFKLSQMSKTMDVKFILCSPKGNKHEREVMDRLSAKRGVVALVEYNDPKELLDKVDQLFV